MKKKILVIRFNAIGDIVLTSPVIKALSDNNYEVHYLLKKGFSELVTPNPNVFKVWHFDDNFKEIIRALKGIEFYAIVDLHNTLRSYRLIKALACPRIYKLKKPRLKYWLLTKLHIPITPEAHIVDRFLNVIEPIVGKVDNPQTEFCFYQDLSSSIVHKLPASFVCIGVGAAFYTKTIPIEKIVDIINKSHRAFVLLGGPKDVDNASIIEERVDKNVLNLVGQLSLSESAHVISRSDVLLSGDTGLMHIGAALGSKMVNVFGSTHPILGYTPYYGAKNTKSHIIQVKDLNCRPCTKQGRNTCPKGHFKCMNDINVDEIINII